MLYILGILGPCVQCKFSISLPICHLPFDVAYRHFGFDSLVGFVVSHSNFDHVVELSLSFMTTGCWNHHRRDFSLLASWGISFKVKFIEVQFT